MAKDCKGREYEIVDDLGRAKNIIGDHYGMLTVVAAVKMIPSGSRRWLCVCNNCGNEITVTTGHLNDGSTTSCGCMKRKENKEIERILDGLLGDN